MLMGKHLLVLISLSGLSFLVGCGGGNSPAPAKTATPPTAPALAITSGAPPSSSVGTSYAGNGFSLTASGGTAPYQWSWTPATGSSLPPGLNLSTPGLISGTPQLGSTYNVVVTVTDSSSAPTQVSATYPIVITGPSTLAITSAAPPDGTVGADYGPAITETFS